MVPDPLVDQAGIPELTTAIRRLCLSAVDVRIANYRLGAARDGRSSDPEAEGRIAQLAYLAVADILRSLGLWADDQAGRNSDQAARGDLRRVTPGRLKAVGPGD